MAILACGHCGHLREVLKKEYIGKKVKCPSCQKVTLVHDTVALMTELLQETTRLNEELIKLKQRNPPTSDQQTQQQKGYAFANLSSSPLLENFQDVVQWFKAKQIEAKPDEKAMDISGFFDEIAVQLGDNWAILGEICHKIKGTQAKGYPNLVLNLSSHSQQEIQVIKRFCQEAYDKAFLTGYHTIDKDKKRVKLHLQTDKTIVKFFNGDWLEWYVFMKVASLLVEKQDKQELDVFFLLKGSTLWGTTTPLWIECKSGEFRNSVEKYAKLRNRLQIDKPHSLLLALGISEENATGLTSMFDITVVNEKNFLGYITGLL
jgi:phage FluMu protein Com